MSTVNFSKASSLPPIRFPKRHSKPTPGRLKPCPPEHKTLFPISQPKTNLQTPDPAISQTQPQNSEPDRPPNSTTELETLSNPNLKISQDPVEDKVITLQRLLINSRFIESHRVAAIKLLICLKYDLDSEDSIHFYESQQCASEDCGVYRYRGFTILGLKEGWGREFYANGGLLYEGLFIGDKRHAMDALLYWPNMQLYYKGNILAGKREGFGQELHSNGRLRYECFHINGEIDSQDLSLKIFYCDGILYFFGVLKNGQKTGHCQIYHFNGNLRSGAFYVNDKICCEEAKFFYED
jgi:hypothetical protein